MRVKKNIRILESQQQEKWFSSGKKNNRIVELDAKVELLLKNDLLLQRLRFLFPMCQLQVQRKERVLPPD